MTVWDDLLEDFAMMDRERGYKEPYGAPDIKAALMEAKEEGRLEELLSTPGWEVWCPDSKVMFLHSCSCTSDTGHEDDCEFYNPTPCVVCGASAWQHPTFCPSWRDPDGEDAKAIKEKKLRKKLLATAMIVHDSITVDVPHTIQEKILITDGGLEVPWTLDDIDRHYPGDFPIGPYSMGCNKSPLNFHEHKIDATLASSKKLTEASRKMAESHLLPFKSPAYSEAQSRMLGAEIHSAMVESLRSVLQKGTHLGLVKDIPVKLLDPTEVFTLPPPPTKNRGWWFSQNENDSVVITSTSTQMIVGATRLEMVVSFFNEEGDVEAMTASDLMAKTWMVEKRYGYINTRKPHPHAAAWINKPVPSRTGSQEDIVRVKDLGWAEIQRNLREWPYGLTLASYSDHCVDTGMITVILRWE